MGNIETQPNHLITLPRRGLRIIAPEHTKRVMALAQQHLREGTSFTPEERQDLWPPEEKARLRIMKNCKILKQRYPSREDGENFMRDVDYQRRDELLDVACDLTINIVSAWDKIKPESPIAVIIFGSVAKGLVKRDDHPDPSNIDLTVIGEINSEEKERLFDAIRLRRDRIRQGLLAKVSSIESKETNPGNAGVMIQDIEKLRKQRYGVARNYIASGAFALWDPAGIWSEIEGNALKQEAEKHQKRRTLKPKTIFVATQI